MALFGLDPHVERHLIADEGEMIVDEVTKHWAALVLPVLELCASVLVLLITGFFPKDWYWIPILGSIEKGWRLVSSRRFSNSFSKWDFSTPTPIRATC